MTAWSNKNLPGVKINTLPSYWNQLTDMMIHYNRPLISFLRNVTVSGSFVACPFVTLKSFFHHRNFSPETKNLWRNIWLSKQAHYDLNRVLRRFPETVQKFQGAVVGCSARPFSPFLMINSTLFNRSQTSTAGQADHLYEYRMIDSYIF